MRGGTLRVVVDPDPPTILTVDNSFGASQKVGPKIVEGLFAHDFQYGLKPQLATSYSLTPDGLRYTFQLRKGVKWHDGADFTSADVAFSISLLKELQTFGRMMFANLVETRTPDPHTVELVLSKPAPFLLRGLSAAVSPIIPRHIYDDGTPFARHPRRDTPIGTGPFVFKEWVRGSHIILERNPNYWDPGKPYLDRIIFRYIADAAARTAAIETGEVDIVPDNRIPLSEIERLKALPHLQVSSLGYDYLGNHTQLELNLDNPVLQDLRVRQALAHAIDLKVLLNTVWYGYGQISPTPINPHMAPYHDPSIKPLPFDLKKAAALLDEAGHKADAKGRRFGLKIVHNPGVGDLRRVSDYVQQALGKIGIEVTIQAQDFASYVKAVYTDRNFDLNAGTLANLFDPTVGVQRIYWSQNIKKGVAFSNGSHYSNPEVDRLLEAASVATDDAERIRLFHAFQKIAVADLPLINFIAVDQFTVANTKLRNFAIGAYGASDTFADTYFQS
ncbi:peptide/nickel transport system substrate-binding protein [Azospirillum agricola]|uniref:ABC transporter substrate-binding protein n=1 Tax=Azospirillum agricola TaxID=1720247 RepID=UPI001AEB85B7|nr:ABC transporter substrate-binding protein [Azospirillum agricola]MBP2231851.1 peptide/nickel transport system substrate-binding protein [Azospirillum agricola]